MILFSYLMKFIMFLSLFFMIFLGIPYICYAYHWVIIVMIFFIPEWLAFSWFFFIHAIFQITDCKNEMIKKSQKMEIKI
jgi:hypothetical protein